MGWLCISCRVGPSGTRPYPNSLIIKSSAKKKKGAAKFIITALAIILPLLTNFYADANFKIPTPRRIPSLGIYFHVFLINILRIRRPSAFMARTWFASGYSRFKSLSGQQLGLFAVIPNSTPPRYALKFKWTTVTQRLFWSETLYFVPRAFSRYVGNQFGGVEFKMAATLKITITSWCPMSSWICWVHLNFSCRMPNKL